MIDVNVIGKIELFADLNEAQRKVIAALAEPVACKKGEALFPEGSAAAGVYVLLEGKIAIRVQQSYRPEHITIVILKQYGQLVGWSGMVAPHNYSAEAICEEDAQLIAFDGKDLMAALEADPEMGFHVMRRIAETISDRLRNIQSVVLKTL